MPCVVEPATTCPSSAEPRASRSLIRLFALPSSPPKFSRLRTNLSSSTASGPDKVVYPMLKHRHRSARDFLQHIFNLSWSLHFFSSIWKTTTIIPIHETGKPLYSSASFRPIYLSPSASKSFLNALFHRFYSSFWSLTPFTLSAKSVSAVDGLLSIKFIFFLSSLRMNLTQPNLALGRFSLLSTSPKLSTLSGVPPFFTNLFRLASFLALLVGFYLSFLIGALA